MIVRVNRQNIFFSHTIQELCVNPYYNHPKGCPNFNKKKGCPPNQSLIDEVLDFSEPIYCVWRKFNVGEWAERMKVKHPNWTNRQCYCCLYWQSRERKKLIREINNGHYQWGYRKIILCPEAYGVNVSRLMLNMGIILEWMPKQYTYLVALCGWGNTK